MNASKMSESKMDGYNRRAPPTLQEWDRGPARR